MGFSIISILANLLIKIPGIALLGTRRCLRTLGNEESPRRGLRVQPVAKLKLALGNARPMGGLT